MSQFKNLRISLVIYAYFLTGGPRLRASQLIRQITEVLRDEFMLGAYGLDYSSVLLKNVLTVRKYCSEIGEKTWHGKFYSGNKTLDILLTQARGLVSFIDTSLYRHYKRSCHWQLFTLSSFPLEPLDHFNLTWH